jgi:hypothetical protein
MNKDPSHNQMQHCHKLLSKVVPPSFEHKLSNFYLTIQSHLHILVFITNIPKVLKRVCYVLCVCCESVCMCVN